MACFYGMVGGDNMDIITILKANIRHQKSSFIGILILMFIVSLSMTAVLTVSINSQKSDEEALEHVGFGDMMVVMDHMGQEEGKELIQKVQEHDLVEKVQVIPAICANFKEINGKSTGSSVVLEQYQPEKLNFRIFNENGTGYIENPKALKAGEMYVPICYSTSYHCNVGDTITVKLMKHTENYTVKGFFEDPFMGSSMMGIKTILVSADYMENMQKSIQEGTADSISEGMLLNIFQKKSSNLSYLKFQQELNKDTGVSGYAWISMGTSQAMGYMLILVRIFSGSLLVFIALLLIITLIIMNHSIGSSIEMEYVNLGILKAVGVTQGKLKIILMLQYLLGALAGAVLGIPVAIPVIRIVNQITTPVVGILTPNHLALGACFMALAGVLVFLMLFIWLKLRKLKEITPVRAICGGKEDIYFSSRVELPIRKKGISFWLAFRQLTSNGKKYISVGVITGLLVFFMIMMGHMDNWMGEDGSEFSRIFDATEYDLWVHCYNEEIQGEVENTIQSYSEIEKKYQIQNVYLMMDGCQMMCFVCEAPEEIGSVLEGRTCRYDNEILVTEFVAKDLNLQIGDTVTVAANDKSEEYIISGIYQCANDMGSNFAMSKAGYLRIGNQSLGEAYCLKNGEKAKEIAEKLNEVYGTELMVTAERGFNEMSSIVSAVKALSVLVYVIAIIFALVVISLVCGKIFAKERQDYGIYKAMGFTARNLRLQFALRFMIVSLLGSGLGVILTLLLMNQCFAWLLSYVGISHIETEIVWMSVLVPIGMMTVVFFLFSYWKAGKIKKVQPRVLISE